VAITKKKENETESAPAIAASANMMTVAMVSPVERRFDCDAVM
jgi:hypothetical protein